MSPADTLRNGYDVFISHNHRDKLWVRGLAKKLADVEFNGRPLRPWLDEQVLDPGDLGQDAELTSALDRSRLFVIVLSPASVASAWVAFELDYFLEDRSLDEIVGLIKTPCAIPAALAGATVIDLGGPGDLESCVAQLIQRICPPGEFGVADAQHAVDQAWEAAIMADPGGLDAEPTPERDAVLAALLRFDIDNPEAEGLALTAFQRAARLVLRDAVNDHPAAYNMRMLLGECLAVAVTRSPRYRHVAQHYLDLEDEATEDPVLAFVVLRTASKLAELDPSLIDLGSLLRVAARLDAVPPLNNKKITAAMLLGRIAAKLRGADLGDLLIQTLSEGAAAARIAAIGGISTGDEHSPPVYFVSELAALHYDGTIPPSGASEPPSRKLQALLFAADLDQPNIVRQKLDNAKSELRRDFGIDDLPYGHTWFALQRESPAPHSRRAPFMGTVMKATAANMEEIALRLDPSHVVCLTEPRIVDALFDRAGALLIPLQEVDSPQCRRLAGRGVPFAMLDQARMAAINDGDVVEIESGTLRVVRNR